MDPPPPPPLSACDPANAPESKSVSGAPNPGTHFNSGSIVSYNGVAFTEIIRSHVRCIPEYNKQDTAIKSIEYIIEIEAIVSPNAHSELGTQTMPPTQTTVDSVMLQLRKKLLAERKKFRYTDKGFGILDIEFSPDAKVQQDVRWGPKPRLLLFEPLAGNHAARIFWVVSIRTNECDNGFVGASEFWVKSAVSVNKMGYQTLTRVGYVELMVHDNPLLKKISVKLSEDYKRIINLLLDPQSMQGYHLTQRYDFSPDNKSCNFLLTYEEIESPNAYPLGVVDIDCQHTTGTKLIPEGFKRWNNSFTCDITLRPKVSPVRAWEIFLLLAVDRIAENVRGEPQNIDEGEPIIVIRVPIILNLSVTEHLFKHQTSFSIEWISWANTIVESFNQTGIFKPVDAVNTSWTDWVVDIRDVQNVDGAYPITNHGSTEIIVSPCNQTVKKEIPDTVRELSESLTFPLFNPQNPPEESSWIKYENTIKVKGKSSSQSHKRYRKKKDIKRGKYDPEPYTPVLKQSEEFEQTSTEKDYTIQDTGDDIITAGMTGAAVRVGSPTKPPEIKSVGGNSVRIIGSRIEDRKLAGTSTPVHLTMWDIMYEVLGSVKDKDLNTTKETTGGEGRYK